jgi:hypothetical protein
MADRNVWLVWRIEDRLTANLGPIKCDLSPRLGRNDGSQPVLLGIPRATSPQDG